MGRIMQSLALGKTGRKDQAGAEGQRCKDLRQAASFCKRKGKRVHVVSCGRQPRRRFWSRFARPVSWLAGRSGIPPSRGGPQWSSEYSSPLTVAGAAGALVPAAVHHSPFPFQSRRFAMRDTVHGLHLRRPTFGQAEERQAALISRHWLSPEFARLPCRAIPRKALHRRTRLLMKGNRPWQSEPANRGRLRKCHRRDRPSSQLPETLRLKGADNLTCIPSSTRSNRATTRQEFAGRGLGRVRRPSKA